MSDVSVRTLAEQLTQETNFLRYIELLSKAAKRYCVFVVSNDTPCGAPDFTDALAAKLCRALGTRILLHDKFRCTYVVAVNEGKLLYENISQGRPIEFAREINKVKIHLKSESFREDRNHRALIEIDGVNRAVGGRGLSIVVFDKKKKEVIDSIAFDTYNQHGVKPGQRTKITGKEWNDFYLRNPGVTFLNFSFPAFPTRNFSRNEKYILEHELNLHKILENADKPISAISEYIPSPEGLYEVLSPPALYFGTDGVRRFFDKQGRYVNIENGHRITLGQPECPKRSIWFVGGCLIFGVGCRDICTVQSILQALLNELAPEQSFSVHNYGYYLWNVDNMEEILALLNWLPIKPGDIVFNVPHIPTEAVAVGSVYGERPHNFGELFWDIGHYTENANALVARVIFNTLSQHNFFSDTSIDSKDTQLNAAAELDNTPRDYGLLPEQFEMLELYKSNLSAFYEQHFGNASAPPVVGSIVMNCNPFTLGHRHLIEQAAKKVDLLVIFVVQEDKSFFPFEDRIDLVDKGTEDLPNVAVTESGNFIISSLTFSEYFNKSELQDLIIDSSNDVTLFAREIAPVMHISVRFAGSEPFDRVTRQYNETLRAILPRYGIRFEELPRIEQNGEAISASRVRQLLEDCNWDAIERLVPMSTFEYLRNRFK